MIFIIISVLTLVMAYIWLRPSHSKDLPPLPSTPYPIVGNLLDMRKGTPIDVFYKWRKQAGDIFSVYLGSRLCIVVTNHELLKEMLKKKEESFYERMEVYFASLFPFPDGTNRFVGNTWKEIRKTTLTIFRDFGMGKEIMAEKIGDEISRYHKALQEQNGKPIDIKMLLDKAITNVITSVLMGRRYDYNDTFFKDILVSFRQLSNMMKSAFLIDLFYYLRYLPGDLFKAKKLKVQTESHLKFFSEHNEMVKKSSDQGNFMKAYQKEVKKAAENGRANALIDEDIPSLSYTLFITGAESTSSTLAWTLVFSVNYPDIQKKVFEEIKRVVGPDRLPKTQDRKQLHYVNAYIAEVQRFREVIPIPVPRVCSKETTLGGYRVPKGAMVTSFYDAIVKDEGLWGDPMVFRPERFLDANGVYSPPDFHIPYYLGKRACPGEALAVMELFLYVSTTFQRFEVLPEDPKNLPSLEPDYEVTGAPFPFKVRFMERVQNGLQKSPISNP